MCYRFSDRFAVKKMYKLLRCGNRYGGKRPSVVPPEKWGVFLFPKTLCVDLAASQIICHDGEVPMIEEAKRRGYVLKKEKYVFWEMTLILSELRIIFILTQKGERYFPCCRRFCSRNRMLFVKMRRMRKMCGKLSVKCYFG